MTIDDAVVSMIQAAVHRESAGFTTKLEASSLQAAVDIWLARVAGRKSTPAQRTRLINSVMRGTAPETKDVQLTHAALRRSAGWDESAAAAAAAAAGATFGEVGAVLGISAQGAREKILAYQRSVAKDLP